MTTGIFYHPDCALHENGPTHPERPERFLKPLKALQNLKEKNLLFVEGIPATDEQILRAHTQQYLDHLNASLPQRGHVKLDEDTSLCPLSLKAARAAAGTVCHAVDQVLSGYVRNAFCLIRPPGHHAFRDHSMGFCIFNNIAIGAFEALASKKVQRIAIVDFDVHHGNGTQNIVGGYDDILFISLQQNPLWPGTGGRESSPHKNIINIPVPPQSDSTVYHKAFEEEVIPALKNFAPELMFISAGFDAHRDDPPKDILFNDAPGRQNLMESDYARFTAQLMALTDGKVISALEGGYNLEVLTSCIVSHVKTLSTYLP